MQIIRGTTPTIVIILKNDIDLDFVKEVWVYIWQSNKVKVDKKIQDISIDSEKKTMTLKLEQDDTLNLKSGDALFQIRMLTNDDTAIATIASKIQILEIYKDGVIA